MGCMVDTKKDQARGMISADCRIVFQHMVFLFVLDEIREHLHDVLGMLQTLASHQDSVRFRHSIEYRMGPELWVVGQKWTVQVTMALVPRHVKHCILRRPGKLFRMSARVLIVGPKSCAQAKKAILETLDASK